MAEPVNSKGVSITTDEARRRTENQDTVLLSDLPEASASMPEQCAPSSPATPHLSAQALAALSQRYDILAEAGHGSMGNVYKARDRETGETVALKLLKPEIASDQAMMDRFKNELLFARKITHKNVCRVHEFNRIGGVAYTSMEFVEGESLRSVLNRFGGLPVRKATDLALQICSGLQEAHAQEIVHRDLKPENVMIDTQGNVKIMDFGIARSMEAGTRLTGSMVGTPAYMAPEQVAGKPVDYRTDIYSLGLMLYEIFTGAPAFQADNAVAVALKQMRESPTPPREIEPGLPVAIERAILKCLEKEPSKRFQSIGELRNVLKAPAGQTMPLASPIATQRRSSNDMPLASHPLYGSSALSAAEPKRASSGAWLLLGAFLVGAAFAGWRWVQVVQAAQHPLPPASLAAPKPPDFAFEIPVEQPETGSDAAQPEAEQPDASQPSAGEPSPVQPPAPEPAAAKPTAPVTPAAKHVFARAVATAKNQPAPGAPEDSSEQVQERADKALGETEPVVAPPVNDHTPSYLWIGRFEREERAQTQAKKIEDLGLPVAVVPRHNATGDFFVVLTGPFGPERVVSVMDWLKTQGFLGVRLVKSPPENDRQGSSQNQNPNP